MITISLYDIDAQYGGKTATVPDLPELENQLRHYDFTAIHSGYWARKSARLLVHFEYHQTINCTLDELLRYVLKKTKR